MTNKNRQKGKRWERIVNQAIQDAEIPTDMVKDGYTDDQGDILLWRDFAVIQCKDAQDKRWTEWFSELAHQAENAGATYQVLSIKQRGKTAADAGLHMVPFNNLISLIKAAKWAHENGYQVSS